MNRVLKYIFKSDMVLIFVIFIKTVYFFTGETKTHLKIHN